MEHVEYWVLQKRNQNAGACIGVSLGDTYISIVEFSGQPGEITLEHYASQPIAPGAVQDRKIIDPEAVGKALQKAVKRSGTHNKKAAISVPNSEVISKTISIPSGMSSDEIEQHILFKAPQLIPQPLDNIYIDHQALGPDPEHENRQLVLLAACRRGSVDIHAEILKHAKLKPRFVDVDEYAIRNASRLLRDSDNENQAEETVALFELGFDHSRLIIESNDQRIYSRDMGFEGKAFAMELISQYGLSSIEQLTDFLSSGRLRAEDIHQPLADFAQLVATHIDNTLQFYFSTEAQTAQIDRVLITGDCALYPGLTQHAQAYLDWPIYVGDPFRNISFSSQAQKQYAHFFGPSLMVASGLALRSIWWRNRPAKKHTPAQAQA